MVTIFKNLGERSTTKSHHHVSLLSIVGEVFGKLVNNRRIVDQPEKCSLFFLISSMLLSLLDQLKIFLQLYLIRIARFFNKSGAT